MSGLISSRRGFLVGLGALLAAPALIRAENLMPVRSVEHLLYPWQVTLEQDSKMAGTLVARLTRANYELSPPERGIKLPRGEALRIFSPQDLDGVLREVKDTEGKRAVSRWFSIYPHSEMTPGVHREYFAQVRALGGTGV